MHCCTQSPIKSIAQLGQYRQDLSHCSCGVIRWPATMAWRVGARIATPGSPLEFSSSSPAMEPMSYSPDRGTDLHLADDEAPRSGDSLWAGGLIEQVIEADVFVAGGGSAGTAAALAAAQRRKHGAREWTRGAGRDLRGGGEGDDGGRLRRTRG